MSMIKYYYVYILYSLRDHKLYTGFTTDVAARIKNHNEGKTKSTANRRPLVLIFAEKFISQVDARAREMFLKTGTGRAVVKGFLKNTLEKIS
jgi:putative endonuclease